MSALRKKAAGQASARAKQSGGNGVPFEMAYERLRDSASKVFADPRVRSLGIGKHGSRYGYRVVRNSAIITPESAVQFQAEVLPQSLGVPLTYVDTPHEVEHHVKVPYSGPGSPTVGSHVLEQGRFRPLFSGLQMENYDDDVRTNVISKGYIVVGTLGN